MEEKKVLGMPIARLLSFTALVALPAGLLWAILAAAGAGGFASGTTKAAMFFEGALYTVFFTGILLAASELISRK